MIRRRDESPARFGRLYRGLTTVDFVGRKRTWFTISLVIIVLGIASLGDPGIQLRYRLQGRQSWEVLAPHASIAGHDERRQTAGLRHRVSRNSARRPIRSRPTSTASATPPRQLTNKVADAMAKWPGSALTQVSLSTVGPTWGGQITNKALEALIVFFIAVVAYISIRFEPKMAIAAFIAMVHDLLVTVGVYSLFGFQITPDTVIAILTILGYSLYDTVVVFDRVRDNTDGILKSGDLSYGEMVNLSMNQTLARSINTSLVAILPVLAVLRGRRRDPRARRHSRATDSRSSSAS